MTSSTAIKLFLSVLTTGGIASGTAYGIYEFNRETIGNKLKNTLLTNSEADKEKWIKRAATLKNDNANLSEDLKKIKNGNADGSNIRTWCNANLKIKFSSEKDQLSENMKKIKEDLEKENEPNKDALKNWCEKAYNNPYKGETDQDYLDAKNYCIAS